MRIIDGIVFGTWIVFWVYWLAASVGVKAARSRRLGQFAGFRVAVILVTLVLLRTGVFRGADRVHNPALQSAGLALIFTGLALAVWARVYLGRNWGTPMSQKVDPELVTTGPYRRVRHPIYSGIILAVIGTAIAISPYWFVAVVVLGGYFIYSATVEERNMRAHFPQTYPEYKSATKMLIPYIF